MLARKLLKALIRELKDNSIVGRRNQAEFEKYLYPVMIEKSIRTSFQLNEHNPNAFLKKAVIKSPLSASIGRICSAKIEKILSQNQGEMMYIRIALAIYECIQKTNTTIMNDIAVLTPDDRSGGESLKHRVLDRYSNIIRSIDVLTLTDVLRQDMTKYSCVLLFENEKPLGLNDKVKQLQVDYFFVERDVKNFYEEVAIPSRRYERAFAIPKAEDYIRNCKITSLDEIKEKMIPQISSQSLIRQLREYQISTVDICNYTLNVILFAADDSECFSKLITLSKEMVYKERYFARIFIHAVCLNGNMVRLKTAEKVIRNLTQIEDTNENILTDHPIDFYDYYIYGQKVDCP
ncbi:MAG: hypothetical protein EOM64_02590 [Erysipelotrichia bacterium]|nr:hypothetical protein [Erysipelotrichia bacterium]